LLNQEKADILPYMNREYELTLLINPSLLQEEALDVQRSLTSLIQECQGTVISSTEPVKRILGHEIKKSNQAYICEASFSLLPEKLSEFEKKIKEEKNIVRYMILIKHPKPKEKPKRVSPEKALERISAKTSPPKKISLGDIDKKIDEILSE
jgi:ribosomal protein S6